MLSQTVNKNCKNSWMKHTIETANGDKIITGFILMIKNVTLHLADQLRHTVTSFWWCNQLYAVDPCTMWGPADKSNVCKGRNVYPYGAHCKNEPLFTLLVGFLTCPHYLFLSICRDLIFWTMEPIPLLLLSKVFLLFHQRGSRDLSIRSIYSLLKSFKTLFFNLFFQKV